MGFTTLKDVAQRAGTTPSTVSYVLNQKKGRYVSEQMRRRVLEAAEELHYIKSYGASSLKGKSRRLLSILVPQFENQFFTRLIVAAEKILMQAGYDLVISNTDDNPEKEKEIIERMVGQRVDGIIVTPTAKGAENTEILRKVKLPMVVVDRPLMGVPACHRVATDNYGFGVEAAEHLIRMGHSHIGYIDWASGITALEDRRIATMHTYHTHGFDEDHVVVVEKPFSFQGGYEATKEILEHHPEVTALFYGFHMQAIGGVAYLNEKGIRIPDAISVMLIGSPDWATIGHFCHIDMGDSAIGEQAAKVLLDQIDGKLSIDGSSCFLQKGYLVEGPSVKNIGGNSNKEGIR